MVRLGNIRHFEETEQRMALRIWGLVALLAAVLLAGCSSTPPTQQPDVAQLANAITALGPDVDPEEAQRAARIAHSYGRQLAQEYGVTDPPLIHNSKVHQGLRERGLCNHYAEDMLKRLKQENFTTLELHWAASPPTFIRIGHHSPIISRRGASLSEGIILDAWRNGGALFWAPTKEDTRYNWRPVLEVEAEFQAAKDKQLAAQRN